MMSRLSSAVKRQHPPLCTGQGLQSPSLAGTHPDQSQKEQMVVTTPTRAETEQGKKGPSRPIALGKVNLLVALLGLLALGGEFPQQGARAHPRGALAGPRAPPRDDRLAHTAHPPIRSPAGGDRQRALPRNGAPAPG